MSSFTNTTIQVLVVGAVILAAGVFYQSFASYRMDEADMALRRIQSAQVKADTTRKRAEQYVSLIADMAHRKIDRQEPLSLVTEFSPREISQVGPLLSTLYQRDGSFFLKRFQLTWRDANEELGLLPRVALDLEGRKVLLFSDQEAAGLPVTPAGQ
ncbi:MAG: hypothetical protein RPU64_13415 [Candidatus Sedimenticola sp. (ex Thyasira tokunagai)]